MGIGLLTLAIGTADAKFEDGATPVFGFNHILYIVIDDAGLVCSESHPTRMVKGETRRLIFDTSSVCSPTGILLQDGQRYLVSIKAQEPQWLTGRLRRQPLASIARIRPQLGACGDAHCGPNAPRVDPSLVQDVAKTGSVGGEKSFLDPDPKDHSIEEVIRARRDGELFFFVNDAVIGVPGLAGAFYVNNRGTAEITVTRR